MHVGQCLLVSIVGAILTHVTSQTNTYQRVPSRHHTIIKNLTELKMTEKIKQDILSRLGMNGRPTPPPANIKENRTYVTELKSEINEIISFSEPPDNFNDEKIIQFRFAKELVPGRLRVKSASLLVRVKSKQWRRKKPPRIDKSSQVTRRSKRKQRRGTRVLLSVSSVTDDGLPAQNVATIKSRIKKHKWFRVSLNQGIMQHLVDTSNGTVLLYVQCKSCRRNTRVVLVQSQRRRKRNLKGPRVKNTQRMKLNKARPYLVLRTFMEAPDQERDKRSLSTECWSGSERCCKMEFYVNFTDIDWDDWIMHPPGFMTAHCFGVCGSGSGRECVPTRKKSLRLVYRDNTGNILAYTLPEFSIARCGCRGG